VWGYALTTAGYPEGTPCSRLVAQLVSRIEVVPGPIVDNIRAGFHEVSRDEVRAILRSLGLLDAIRHLDGGLQAELEPDGHPLSREELVLLMVARSLARRPRLLIIERFLDLLPQHLQHAVLTAVPADCTLLCSSVHSDLEPRMDRVLVLSKGCIIEDRSPEERWVG
jgi:ABC-type multidrug transport system fused ATPase/permease subunit